MLLSEDIKSRKKPTKLLFFNGLGVKNFSKITTFLPLPDIYRWKKSRIKLILLLEEWKISGKRFPYILLIHKDSVMSEKAIRFDCKRDVNHLPPCPSSSKTPYAWHKHATQAGFYVRASKEDSQGKFERRYFHRYKHHEPDGRGGVKPNSKEIREDLGVVQPGSKADYDEAYRRVLEKRRELKIAQHEGVSTRLTVAGAWAYCLTERFNKKDATKGKEADLFQRYFSHIEESYLDELPRAFWSSFLEKLREGTLVVGERMRKDKTGMEPMLLGPLSNATLIGVMNVASLLYEIGNKYNGLQGVLKGTNNPGDLRKQIGTPNHKTRHIPLKNLGTAWRASDQLVSPWWRDLFRVFVLTGLRRSLLFLMRFDEIDFENGVYIIDPRKPGAKRKGENITPDTKHIRLPLSKFVLDIIRARREFAPDTDGLVWFTPKPTRGLRTKKEKASLSDPRTAWTLLEWAIGGLHFSPHDIRRTYASLGSVVTKDLFAVSLLMLHTGEELAKAAGVPGITIKYMDTDEAVERMRAAAEEITAHVLKLAVLPAAEAQLIQDPILVQDLEDAAMDG
jgi:integrase